MNGENKISILSSIIAPSNLLPLRQYKSLYGLSLFLYRVTWSPVREYYSLTIGNFEFPKTANKGAVRMSTPV